MPSRPRPSRLRRTLLVLLTVAVAAAAGFWLTTRADDGTTTAGDVDPVAAPTTEAPDQGGDPVATLEPERTGGVPVPTEPPPEDVAVDEPPAPVGNRADVLVTYAAWDGTNSSVEVNGFVASRVEDGGTCTLTLTQGDESRTASTEAFADATTTVCPPLLVPGGELHPGRWEAVLAYTSDSSTGTSEAVEVDVP